MKHFLCSSAYWVCSLCKQRVFRFHLHWENKNLTPTLSLSVDQYICMPDQNLNVVSEHTTVLNIAQYFLLWKTAANVSTNQKSELKNIELQATILNSEILIKKACCHIGILSVFGSLRFVYLVVFCLCIFGCYGFLLIDQSCDLFYPSLSCVTVYVVNAANLTKFPIMYSVSKKKKINK